MFKRSSMCVLVLGVWLGGFAASTVRAVDAPDWKSPYLSSAEADANVLLADRKKFVQENYQLAPADFDKIVQSLTGLVSVHERYQRESALTLNRLRLAITIVGTDQQRPETERQSKVDTFRGQYHRILAKAPLSLQNVVKLTEAAQTTDQIAPAHAKIEAKFAEASKISGIPFSIENLDALACGPLNPGPRPEIRLPEPPAPEAAPAPPAPSPIAKTSTHQTPSKQPDPRGPIPIPPPNIPPPRTPIVAAPIPPAPPVAQWSELVKQLEEKYELTPDQRTSVENVLKQSQDRADEHRKKNQGSYDEAAGLSDEDAKMKKLQELNKPVDSIYDQMKNRIDSIASIEQRNKAAEKEKAAKE